MDRAELFSLVMVFAALIITAATTALLSIAPKKSVTVDKDIVYCDRFVEIYPDYMILNGFLLGPIGKKRIAFDSVSRIELICLDFWSGRYRVQGTGDFRTWFAHDIDRSSKGRAFLVHRVRKRLGIGFSAEDFDKVTAIFEAKGLLHGAKIG